MFKRFTKSPSKPPQTPPASRDEWVKLVPSPGQQELNTSSTLVRTDGSPDEEFSIAMIDKKPWKRSWQYGASKQAAASASDAAQPQGVMFEIGDETPSPRAASPSLPPIDATEINSMLFNEDYFRPGRTPSIGEFSNSSEAASQGWLSPSGSYFQNNINQTRPSAASLQRSKSFLQPGEKPAHRPARETERRAFSKQYSWQERALGTRSPCPQDDIPSPCPPPSRNR